MALFKCLTFLIVLCVVQVSLAKPATESTTNALTEGRGVMSSIWEWISYPFTWWSSPEAEQPSTEQLVASTTEIGVTENIKIKEQNVTIWCNDQTCTTMKCDKTECRNVTCNLYDTDLHGQCREYNILQTTLENSVPQSTEGTTKAPVTTEVTEKIVTEKIVSESTIKTPVQEEIVTLKEQLLELEAVLSSTINEKNVENNQKSTLTSD